MTYYIKDSILPVDEDEMWEFKAHRNFSSDEVPAWHADGTKVRPQYAMHEFYKLKNANRTRQPISRNLSGFLNAGRGGTILIGVLDNGKVVGMGLNPLQKDHLLLSLEDALRRFNPPVPIDFVKVAFIPVIDYKEELQDVANPKICEPPWDVKHQAHQLRTSSLCWCDLHTMHRFQLGFMPTQYVIEVRIAALHPKLRTPEIAKILTEMMKDYKSPVARLSWPAFTSEDGNLFCRVLNSLIKFTEDEITQFNYCQTKDFLRKELSLMETDNDVKKNRRLQFLLPGVTLSKAHLESILDHDEKEELALQEVNDNDLEDEPASPLTTDVANHVPMSDLSFDSTAENGFSPNIPDISVSEMDMLNLMFLPGSESSEDADEADFAPTSENKSEDLIKTTDEMLKSDSEANFVPMSENNSENSSTMKTDELPGETDFVPTSENYSEMNTAVEMSNLDSEADCIPTPENNSEGPSPMKTDEIQGEPDFDTSSENDSLQNLENPSMDTAVEMSNPESEVNFVPMSENISEYLSTVKTTYEEPELDFFCASDDDSQDQLTMDTTDELPEPDCSSSTTPILSKDEEELFDLNKLDAETPEVVLKSDFETAALFVPEAGEHELDTASSVSSDMSEHLGSFLHLVSDGDDTDLSMSLSNSSFPTIPSMLLELEPKPKSANN